MPRLNLKLKKEDASALSPEGRALVEEVEQLADEVLAAEKDTPETMTLPQAKSIRAAGGIFYGVTVALCLLLGVMLLLNAFAANGVMGLRFFVEPTNAMLRQVPRGSLLITVMRSSGKIRPGDIITYNVLPDKPDVPGTRLTRIVAERLESNGKVVFHTKRAGDAAPDSMPINMTHILGVKLAVLPGVGYVISFAQTYAAALSVLAGALCVSAAVMRLWANREHPELKDRKRRKAGHKGRVQHAIV